MKNTDSILYTIPKEKLSASEIEELVQKHAFHKFTPKDIFITACVLLPFWILAICLIVLSVYSMVTGNVIFVSHTSYRAGRRIEFDNAWGALIGGIILFLFMLFITAVSFKQLKKVTPKDLITLIKERKYDQAYKLAKQKRKGKQFDVFYDKTIVILGYYIFSDIKTVTNILEKPASQYSGGQIIREITKILNLDKKTDAQLEQEYFDTMYEDTDKTKNGDQ